MAGHVAACSEIEISLERKNRLVNGNDFTTTQESNQTVRVI
jgi:hypothetical protein